MKLKSSPKFNVLHRFQRKAPGKAIVAIALFSLALAFAVGPGRMLLDREHLFGLLHASDRYREALFLGLFVVLTVLGIPGTVLAVAGGLMFGVVWGTCWAVIGATLGATVAFWLSRYLLHDWVAKRWHDHPLLKKCRKAIARRPLQVVLTMRLAPVSPFTLVNYLFGLTPIPWLPYIVGTFFGILPGTLAFVWLGVAGKQAMQAGDWTPLAIVLIALAGLSVLPLLWGRSRRCNQHAD